MNDESQHPAPVNESSYNELGHLIRQLHDTLRELGCDEVIQNLVGELPDTQDRLSYIAQLTEQAAQRVINAVEKAQPLQEKMETDALGLAEEWRNAQGNGERQRIGEKMHAFLTGIPTLTRETSSQLTEILMAQDFQDLTGQVIKKISQLTRELEHQLVHILLISKPADDSKNDGLLNGPVVKKDGRTDIVNGQEEVDDLLTSLGF
ncbi:chemotaxis protein CheZ [Sulfuricella denitrificans skB26]|uniref:Protein phosphatase CheZ n=1 Tax=Sulfuricella denitrificans (strain DSM 22764 / NBRC 105220 / skB26) TaxID=1163617 RepID=S6AZF0_SULDS|nr:protein phosphatase CheZ [Sulfuricella denitrificans]BAN33892.1 chemotaxis protein CheZ [Sulfuricella denitrificans skB26]